jgi:hypothetical protein
MKHIMLILFVTTICAGYGLASAQANQCYVVSYERDPETKRQAGPRIALGAFDWQADKPLSRVVHDQSTGVFIAVRGERVASSGRATPKETIRIAVSFVEKMGDAFDEAGAAEAEATYDERWKQLSVSKNIKVADGLYTYYLSCERGGKKTYRPDPW